MTGRRGVQYHLWMPRPLLDAAKARADRDDVTASHVIRAALYAYLTPKPPRRRPDLPGDLPEHLTPW